MTLGYIIIFGRLKSFYRAYGQKGILIMHKHHWECTDTPGIFMCHAEGQTGYFNSLTKEITEDVG
jgi:hypothetical protein